RVPAGLQDEAQQALRWLALSVPFVVLSLNLRAVLEGAQRFGLANLIRVPHGVLGFVIPAVAGALGVRLPGFIALLLALRIVSCLATWLAVRAVLPGFRWELRPARE